MKISIKDLVDWDLYKKEYSEDDIELKEIHKKADLWDLQRSISFRIKNSDRPSFKRQHCIAQFLRYRQKMVRMTVIRYKETAG